LVANCRFVITDSGGIQEETTYLRIPCLTLRPNTERPVTVDTGTNELVPFDISIIRKKADSIINGQFKKGEIPQFWDGKATRRILEFCKTVI
jgi:UDP-N-acetylglucosamine 2-epimerase (non-hydrolysing)